MAIKGTVSRDRVRFVLGNGGTKSRTDRGAMRAYRPGHGRNKIIVVFRNADKKVATFRNYCAAIEFICGGR